VDPKPSRTPRNTSRRSHDDRTLKRHNTPAACLFCLLCCLPRARRGARFSHAVMPALPFLCTSYGRSGGIPCHVCLGTTYFYWNPKELGDVVASAVTNRTAYVSTTPRASRGRALRFRPRPGRSRGRAVVAACCSASQSHPCHLFFRGRVSDAAGRGLFTLTSANRGPYHHRARQEYVANIARVFVVAAASDSSVFGSAPRDSTASGNLCSAGLDHQGAAHLPTGQRAACANLRRLDSRSLCQACGRCDPRAYMRRRTQ
jgi:hypothetical protein